MSKTILQITILLCLSTAGLGQAFISGQIKDQVTNQPLESAAVSTTKSGNVVTSDSRGYFKIRPAAGTSSVNITMIGYRSKLVALTDLGVTPVVYLERGPVNLKEIVITPQLNNGAFRTLSAIDLNMRPVNSSQDLLRLVPGLFLGQHQGGGIAEHIFFRGFDADHGTDVNVSVDGMPVNLVSHAHGQGFADLHFLIPELVTSYEFGKGPYFADKGDFTTAGYVSFKTPDAINKNMVKVEGGQFNTGRIMSMINLVTDKAKQRGESGYVAGEAAYTDGPFDFAQRFNRFNLFGKYNVTISPKSRLGITLSTFSSSWRSSGEIPERAITEGITDRFGYIDSAQGGRTSRSNAIVKLTSAISDGLILDNQLYYSRYNFNLNYNATFFADDSLNGDQLRQREARDLVGYNGKLVHRKYFKNGTTLTSAAGIGWQLNKIHNSELSHTLDKNTVLEYLQLGNITESALNGYVDESLETGKWLINAGVRVDYLSFDYADKMNPPQPARSRTVISPKLNIEYTANPYIQFYLKSGKGFHSNDAKVVVANGGQQILPAAYGSDLGINWKPLSRLYVNAAIWYLQLEQEFVYDADEGTIEPGGKTKRQGIDVSARYQLNRWLFATTDLNICRARNINEAKGSDYLPLAVPVSATGGLNVKCANGINGGLSYRYMKDRPANEDNSLIAQGYFVTDLTANYTTRKYELGLEVQNLFNTKWREAQFAVESRLPNEPQAIDDISFTAGTPFFAKLKFALFF